MKIAFFNRSYWPDQAATGQLLTELAEDLVAEHGCTVSVVAGRPLHGAAAAAGTDRRWAPIVRQPHRGVDILRANGTRLRPNQFAARALNYVTYFTAATLAARQLGVQDVVVSLTDPPIIGLTALRAARRLGARFVYVCEDIFPEVAALVEDFQSASVNRALDRVNRHLLKEADAVVALGERMRARLVEEKGAVAERVHVIHNWADCRAIAPVSKDNAFTREHRLGDRFVLMHSGNVGLSQNLDVLVDAAALLGSTERLVIAIVGDGARRASLEDRVRARGLTNVRFFPYQSKEQLCESFGAADAFLVSLKPGLEGFIVPSKLYGILAAGRPYIAATDPSAEPAMVAQAQGCGLWANPGDPRALAAAVAWLYDNPSATAAMGVRSRAAAFQYDRRAAVGAYVDLFARLARKATAA